MKMCIRDRTKDVEETDADGNVTTVTKSVLYVNVTLKSYRDMISVYGFNSYQVEMLEQIMSCLLYTSMLTGHRRLYICVK